MINITNICRWKCKRVKQTSTIIMFKMPFWHAHFDKDASILFLSNSRHISTDYCRLGVRYSFKIKTNIFDVLILEAQQLWFWSS